MEISHLMVAYRGGQADDRLLRMGCRVAREARARVSVLHVLEVPMSYALDAQDAPGLEEADRVIEHCDEIGSEVGVSVNAETICARDAGCAVVDHAKSMGVDMILVGSGERPAAGRAPLRSTAEFVLNNASCAVVVGRFPARSNGSGH